MASGSATSDSLRELIESRDENGAVDKLQGMKGAEGIAQQVGSNPKNGLSADAARRNRERFGANEYPMRPPKSFFQLFLATLQDKTLIILMIAAVVNIALGMTIESVKTGWIDGTAILAAVLTVAVVTAANDYAKERQFQELNKVVASRKVSVIRNGKQMQIDIKEIVVGDVALIATGDSLPADGLLLEAAEIQVDESSMTGESDAVVKSLKDDPFLLANTKVMAGTGRMLVVAVGTSSQWGRLKAMLDQPTDETPLQTKLADLAERIGAVGIAAAVLTFGLLFTLWLARNYYIEQRPWKWSQLIEVNRFFLAGVSLIVIAVPEGLPLAVTMSLAYSMRRMMKDNCLVRRLEACETMGGATQICSDKTGTLTENRMTVVRLLVGGQTLDLAGEKQIPKLSDEFRHVFGEAAALNSTATLEVNPETKQQDTIGSKTEGALLIMLGRYQIDYEAVRKKAELLKRWPFSSESKRMGSIVKSHGKAIFYCTGAGEIVSKFCSRIMTLDGKERPLDEKQISSAMRQFAADGLRVIAVAMGAGTAQQEKAPEHDLTLIALVGIKDPVRADVPAAVRRCQSAGVTVRMLTGDNKLTAAHIATECGVLPRGAPADAVMEGSEFRALSDAQLLPAVKNLRVLARASPQDKHRLVRALRAGGEVVAVTGDGTNDAPQLKEADVGFSMGITGTEVAKEASDIVLMDDNFASIVNAIKWGRNVFDSIRKFLQFQLTVTCVAIVLSVVGSVLWDEAPLSPIQMLWVNLIMDTFASLALATEAPTDKLLERPPYGRTEPIITRKMWRFIIGSAVLQLGVMFFFIYAAHFVPWFGLPNDQKSWDDHDYRVRGTIVFNTFVWLQLFNLFHARKLEDEKNIFTGLLNNWIFWAVFAFGAGVQAIIVEFGNGPTSTTSLSIWQWLGCIAAGSLSFFWGFLLRFIPIRNVVRPREEEEPRDEERVPLMPRKSLSIQEIRPASLKKMPSAEVQRNAEAAWRRLRQRFSIVAMFRRGRHY